MLESSSGSDSLSVLVFDPSFLLTALPQRKEIEVQDRLNATGTSLFESSDTLRTLEQMVRSFRSREASFRFMGGAVGYISYDAAKQWIFGRKEDDGNRRNFATIFPDMQFGIYEEGIIFDHNLRKFFYFFSDRVKDRSKEIEEICSVDSNGNTIGRLAFSKPETNVSKEEFQEKVRKAKDHIRNGDIFQVVLSRKYKFNTSGDMLQFYSELKRINPSPYMYFLDMCETKIVGSSPEMLVRVNGGIVETYPIAGTRPSSLDESENSKLARELLLDQKERAEHVMLVDLARNDIGRVSEFGSVSVGEFMQVHRYSHVQHIVSHVTGKLRRNLTAFDAMRSLFPAGTVSGAPKIRALEIIEELETEARGPYAGAVGYFSFNGNMDSAITIRTLVSKGNEAFIQTGAGIVADSEPEAEWFETERKAAALLRALELSSEEISKN
ncbi:MAG: chorismate-binding protein [Nitrososphaerota archaeon]|nr:chorismate-binding protein [Nitrososphaerota archaeon]